MVVLQRIQELVMRHDLDDDIPTEHAVETATRLLSDCGCEVTRRWTMRHLRWVPQGHMVSWPQRGDARVSSNAGFIALHLPRARL